MYIQEAILEAKKPLTGRNCIARESWHYSMWDCYSKRGGVFKLIPTDTPDGFLVVSPKEPVLTRSWQPTVSDLMANDWEVLR